MRYVTLFQVNMAENCDCLIFTEFPVKLKKKSVQQFRCRYYVTGMDSNDPTYALFSL
jgi:hypothetical protein